MAEREGNPEATEKVQGKGIPEGMLQVIYAMANESGREGRYLYDPMAPELVKRLEGASKLLYTRVQLAAREYVGQFRLDELLADKEAIGNVLKERLLEVQGDYCVEVLDVGIKDIILPGEIRDIMNTVLVAEKKAQANVIMRREEVASTRSLLNTAKLMEENPVLYRLKELEYLERICDKVGSISVNGGGNLLEQLAGMVVPAGK